MLLTCAVILQVQLEQNGKDQAIQIEHLRWMPRGEFLRPALLGYHHLGADIVWLRLIQVLGERIVRANDWEWLNHALDVVTTLDPEYAYAYDVGGIVLAEIADRVDWSNRLLEKGIRENPTEWRLPFILAFNYFFHLKDYVRAADYMAQAARLPGHAAYVPEMAARLYIEGKSPSLALRYLETMLQQTSDPRVREGLERRYKEVLIEWHIQGLQLSVRRYHETIGHLPTTLEDLVAQGLLSTIPGEPFGGEYRLDGDRGQVTSTTHPERMRLHRPEDAAKLQKNK